MEEEEEEEESLPPPPLLPTRRNEGSKPPVPLWTASSIVVLRRRTRKGTSLHSTHPPTHLFHPCLVHHTIHPPTHLLTLTRTHNRDEVVKMRIIELLAEAMEGKVGALLEDESVWEVVQTCFVNRNEVAHSKQLCHAAEQVGRWVAEFFLHSPTYPLIDQ